MSVRQSEAVGGLISHGYLRLEGYGHGARLRYTGKPIDDRYPFCPDLRYDDDDLTMPICAYRFRRKAGYRSGVI